MPNKFYLKLEKLLKKDSRFIDKEGDLLKGNVIDSAYKADKKLMEILLSQKEFKSKFFSKIKDALVFNINDFVAYISDKNCLADSYTKYRNKIGLNIDEKFLNERKEVALVWPFKDCVLEGGMTKEDEKRKEIFFNEILAQDEIDKLFSPKVLTNWKKYTAKGQEKVKELKRDEEGIIQENLIIKGNNLLALHSLKQQFQNKIKLIYIDPPYNRDADTFYNDNFKHSTWLTFMKNRLEVAKEMLKNDGVIFIQCDDNEQGYLKILMDEVFKNLYQSTIYIQVRYPEKQLATAMRFHKLIETIFVYSKSEKPLFFQKKFDYDISKYIWKIKILKRPSKVIMLGGKKVEIFEKNRFEITKKKKPSETLLKEIWASGKILDSSSTGRFFRDFITGRYTKDGYGVLYKVHGIGSVLGYRYITGPQKIGATKGKYYQEIPQIKTKKNFIGGEKSISNFYNMAADFGNCRHEGGVELRSGKKPEVLLQKIIEIGSNKGDLIMDFHLGTGGTCAVAHKMWRQYIGVEQLDYGDNDSIVRLQNVIKGDQTGISKAVNWKGGGDFVYCELMKYNEQFVEKIQKAKDAKTLLKIWEEMKARSFLNYNVDIKKLDGTIDEFKKMPINRQKHILFDLLNKNQLYVNLSEIKDKDFKVSELDKKVNEKFYGN